MRNYFVSSGAIAYFAMTTFASAYTGCRTEYTCTGRGVSIAAVSDTDKNGLLNVVGTIGHTRVDYWSHVTSAKDNVMVLKDSKSKIVVQIQRAGPYDGGQDVLWGSAENGLGLSVNLSCYISLGDPFGL